MAMPFLAAIGMFLTATTVLTSAAPRKGGTIRLNGFTPPKSVNAYVDGSTYSRMSFSWMYETLVDIDPETTEFIPCIAESWEISPDAQTFTFHIDPEARWSDGIPITSADVKWTFDVLMAKDSQTGTHKALLGDFDSPDTPDSRTVRFRVHHGERHWRDLLNCGTFEIMPKHVFEGKNFNALTLENAVVSGPYRLAKQDDQVANTYLRRPDWWRGNRERERNLYNFDRVVIRYFADDANAFENFKQGKLDVYAVYSARLWTKETAGVKFDHNWIIKKAVRNNRPIGFQGFSMNMRKEPFCDRKVREAMAHLLDRETLNRTLCHNQYFLMKSYCEDLYDDSHPCQNPVWDYNPALAAQLLDDAGWLLNKDTGRREKNGEPFSFTFLSRGNTEDKFLAPFSTELKKLGIEMKITRSDFAGWMRDMDTFNYYMTWACWGASILRDSEPMWHSKEAERKSGLNLVGFQNTQVDALIEKAKSEFSAAKRNDYEREIDRLICEEVPYVLLWNIDCTRLLYWNKFGMPKEPLGHFGSETSIVTYWWYDPDKSEELSDAVTAGSFLPAVD